MPPRPIFDDELARRNRATVEANKKSRGDIEKVQIYPAGRGRKLVIKTVTARTQKHEPNPRRLCLVRIPSNPQPITVVALKKTDRFFTLWLYPEGRRLSRDEFDELLAGLLAYRKYVRVSPRSHELLGKMHLSLKSITIRDGQMIERVNHQLKRLARRYNKFEGEYCGEDDRDAV